MADATLKDVFRGIATGTAWGLRLFIGGLLVWSGWTKMRQPFDFLSAVYNYQAVGPWVGLMIAVVLPAAELVIGIALLVRLAPAASTLAAAFLSLLFLASQLSAVHHGLSIDCGCFGSSSAAPHIVGRTTVVRAGLLLATTAVLYAAALHQARSTRKWAVAAYQPKAEED